MKSSSSRTSLRLAVALATLLLAAPSHAQQQQPTAATESAPPAPSVAAPQPIPAPGDAGTATDNAGKSLKTVASSLHELSPWSMFLSADIIVKAVMIGLAFASVVTWTIFIAKMIELSVVQTKLRSALNKIGEARSLSEAQFALGSKQGVLTSLLAASMREARL